MLGTTATKQLFASANSIAAIPNLWAEWNYNAFIQPYITTSTSAGAITTSLNSSAAWTAQDMGNGIINGTASWSSGGIHSITDSAASAVKLTVLDALNDATGATASANGYIASNFISSSVSLSGSRFFKLSFYVRTTDVDYSTAYPSPIAASTVTTAVNGSSGASSTYYYRVVPVGSNGQTFGPDIINDKDLKTISSGSTASVTLSWTKVPNATSYVVYRSKTNTKTTQAVGVTASTSYKDLLSITPNQYVTPITRNGHLYIMPQVHLYNSSSLLTQTIYFMKSADTPDGQMQVGTTSIEAPIGMWKKVEVWFGIPADSTENITAMQLELDLVSEYEKASLLVDNISLFPITEHDFFHDNFYTTQSAFTFTRPGEVLLNPLLPTADRTINNITQTPIPRPATLAFKTPSLYLTRETSSPFIQILPSLYDRFTYYVSDSTHKAIQAQYDQYMSINKIVLKYATALTIPTSGSVILYTASNSASTVITLSASDFNYAGVTTLYYNGTSWSTTAWASPPQLTSSGTFQNVVSEVRGITFKADTVTTNPTVMSRIPASAVFMAQDDFKKVHILELSPRLEVDLTPQLISYNVTKDLTFDVNNGFPFSYINANQGSLTLSNIPIYQSSGYASTIFEDSSSKATFYGLMRQGVKMTGFLKSPSFQPDLTENIPQFVMYSNSWSINDIGDVSVEMYDIMKIFAQGKPAAEYSAQNSNIFQILTDFFAISGFSDYDLDELRNICSMAAKTSTFWANENKTIFELLQDILVVHQIGAFVDEYGMMRFKSLQQTLDEVSNSTFTPDSLVTDYPKSLSGVNYIANILPDSYSESVSQKIGNIKARYKIVKNSNSVYDEGIIQTNPARVVNLYKEVSTKAIWNEQSKTGLPSIDLSENLLINNSYIGLSINNVGGPNPRKNIGEYSGDLLIGNEIVGYQGMEYIFYPQQNPAAYISKIVFDESDIQDGINEIMNSFGSSINDKVVSYNSTGRLYNIQRGKYGTPVYDHKIINRNNSASPLFTTASYAPNLTSAVTTTTDTRVVFDKSPISVSPRNVVNKSVFVMPKNINNPGYNLFAVDFRVPAPSKKDEINANPDANDKTDYHNLSLGIFFNMSGLTVKGASNVESPAFVRLQLEQKDAGKKPEYTMSIYTGNKQTPSASSTISIPNVFDGRKSKSGTLTGFHRLAAYTDGSYIKVALDNEIIFVGPGNFGTRANTNFGFFATCLETQKVQVEFSEIYADKVEGGIAAVDYPLESRYLFTTPKYLNNLIKGSTNVTKPFLFQSTPQARGIKRYKVKLASAPVVPGAAFIYPHFYGEIVNAKKSNEELEVIGPVVKGDLSYSGLFITPFSADFVVANNSDQIVYLNSQADQTINPLMLNGKILELTEERVIDKISDINYSQNSVEIQTQWAASESDVEKMLGLLAKSIGTFSTTIDISIFANPLIQVGDFVQLYYSLKRIGIDPANPSDTTVKPLNCLVAAVDQDYSEGLSTTKLKLKPIIIP